MMLPRLQLLRELLREDGSIWVTIDDNEGHYLKVMMDEVFGRGNFVSTLIWEKADSPRNSARQFSSDHDFIHVYARNTVWQPTKLPRTDEANSIYTNPDNDERGPWLPGDPYANT
jgi:adenine-specific DNA-methyltransferase